jgi:hypothetical protein
MSLSANVAELNRLLTQLNVKAALWVGNGGTAQDKDGRAQGLVGALNAFITNNLNFFGSGPADCSGTSCHWDYNLQMCVCDILFASTAYQAAGVRKGVKGKTTAKTKPKAKPKGTAGGKSGIKSTRRPK